MINIFRKNVPSLSGKPVFQAKTTELMGVVVRHGKRPKTITVKVRYKAWWNNFQRFVYKGAIFHVNDEEEYARTGDIVIIRQMRHITKKNYYVRNVIEEVGRQDYWERKELEKHPKEVRDLALQNTRDIKRKWTEKNSRRRVKVGERVEMTRKAKAEALKMALRQLRNTGKEELQ